MSQPTHQAIGLTRLVPNAEPFKRVKVIRRGPHKLAKQALLVADYIEAGLWTEAIAAAKDLRPLAHKQL